MLKFMSLAYQSPVTENFDITAIVAIITFCHALYQPQVYYGRPGARTVTVATGRLACSDSG